MSSGLVEHCRDLEPPRADRTPYSTFNGGGQDSTQSQWYLNNESSSKQTQQQYQSQGKPKYPEQIHLRSPSVERLPAYFSSHGALGHQQSPLFSQGDPTSPQPPKLDFSNPSSSHDEYSPVGKSTTSNQTTSSESTSEPGVNHLFHHSGVIKSNTVSSLNGQQRDSNLSKIHCKPFLGQILYPGRDSCFVVSDSSGSLSSRVSEDVIARIVLRVEGNSESEISTGRGSEELTSTNIKRVVFVVPTSATNSHPEKYQDNQGTQLSWPLVICYAACELDKGEGNEKNGSLEQLLNASSSSQTPSVNQTFRMCGLCKLVFDSVSSFLYHVAESHEFQVSSSLGALLSRDKVSLFFASGSERLQKQRQNILLLFSPRQLMEFENIETNPIVKENSPVNNATSKSESSSSDVSAERNKMQEVSGKGQNGSGSRKDQMFPPVNIKTEEPDIKTLATNEMDLSALCRLRSSDWNFAQHMAMLANSSDIGDEKTTSTASGNDASNSRQLLGNNNYFNNSNYDEEYLMQQQQQQQQQQQSYLQSAQQGPPQQLLMMRNSCKMLKCPKCNWHYKYPETLEIHMREKHPESDAQCVLCIRGQPHPRLARGEAYTCGYKPYRCEVCNYSTTTKGNLSIHMQSDRHINNIQELHNLGQHNSVSPASSQSALPSAVAQLTSQNAVTPVALPSGGTQSPSTPPSSDSPDNSGNGSSSTSVFNPYSKAKSKASWRCEICNYETNVARNLRIHMTSEKHAHNQMVMRQGGSVNSGSLAGKQQTTMDEFQNGSTPGNNAGEAAAQGLIKEQGAFNQKLPGHNPWGSFLPFSPFDMPMFGLPVSMDIGHSLKNQANMVSDQKSFQNSPNVGDKSDLLRPSTLLDHSYHVFQCATCCIFGTDNLEDLHHHEQLDRTTGGSDKEGIILVGGTYICTLCQYKSNLKANFQLHCKTDKHLQRLQLIIHVREGGPENEWRHMQMGATGGGHHLVTVRCNACDFGTNSVYKLQVHASDPEHATNVAVFFDLIARETRARPDAQRFSCAPCGFSSPVRLLFVRHLSTPHHRALEHRFLDFQQQLASLPHSNSTSSSSSASSSFSTAVMATASAYFNKDRLAAGVPPAKEADGSSGGGTQQVVQQFVSNSDGNHSMQTGDGQLQPDLRLVKKEEQEDDDDEDENDDVIKDEVEKDNDDIHHHHHQQQQQQQHHHQHHQLHQLQQQQRTNREVEGAASATSSPPPSSSMTTTASSSSSSSSSLICRLCLESHQNRSDLEMHMISVHSVRPEVLELVLLMNDQHRQHFNDMKSLMRNFCSREDAREGEYQPDPREGFVEANMPQQWQRSRTEQEVNQFFKMSANDLEELETTAWKISQEADLEASREISYRNLTRCPICQEDFSTIQSLFSHQSELGHLELKHKTSQHPGYVCWFPDCGQSFPTAASLQHHFSATHVADAEKVRKGMFTECCQRCDAMFANVSLLERHGLCHSLESLKSCRFCSSEEGSEAKCDSLSSVIEHLRGCHSDVDAFSVMRDFESLLAVVNKYSARCSSRIKQPVSEESFNNSNNNNGDNHHNTSSTAITTTTNNFNRTTSTEKNSPYSDSSHDDDVARPVQGQTEDLSNISSPDDETAEFRYSTDDPNSKYRCHRCKMAFQKQSHLMSHNRTPEHRGKNRSESNDPAEQFETVQMEDQDFKSPQDDSEETFTRISDNCTGFPQRGGGEKQSLYSEELSDGRENNSELSPREIKDASLDRTDSPNAYSEYADWKDGNCASDAAIDRYADDSGKEVTAGRLGFPSGPKITCMKCLNFAGTTYELLIHQQTNCNGCGKSSSRHRSSYYRTLLENVGFECAMLFNESFKNIAKKPGQQDKDAEKNGQDQTKPGDASVDKGHSRNSDIPEINKSLCRYCSKEFSSVWVLKAHEEEEHNGAVPLELVEQFAQAFRKRYDKQNQQQFASAGNSDPYKFDQDNTSNSPNKSGKATPYSNGAGGGTGSSQFISPGSQYSAFASMFKNLSGDLPHMPDFNSPAFKLEMMKQMSMMMMMPGMDLGALGGAAAGGANPLMGLPMIPPSLLPMIFPFGFSPEMFGFPGMGMMFDPNAMANGQQGSQSSQSSTFPGLPGASMMMSQSMPPLAGSLFAQQQQQLVNNVNSLSAAQQQKRARTRITDEQLSILRAHFDISNSPSDEQIAEMAVATQLPPKVIKHWFRNTLFKERQRSKDSPYNFNNPPTTTMLSVGDGEEEQSGEASTGDAPNNNSNNNNSSSNNNNSGSNTSNNNNNSVTSNNNSNKNKTSGDSIQEDKDKPHAFQPTSQDSLKEIKKEASFYPDIKPSAFCDGDQPTSAPPPQMPALPQSLFSPGAFPRRGPHCNPGFFLPPTTPLFPHGAGLPFAPGPGGLSLFGSPHPQHQQQTSTHGKRANRTHFTDQQIKILQEHFEINAYPKDEELEMLSGLLDLSPRVIIVWFQNARQKARKSYENQPQLNAHNSDGGQHQSSGEPSQPALKYQCQVCSANFERYYELIKHQRLQCHKDSNFRSSISTQDPKSGPGSGPMQGSSLDKLKTKCDNIRSLPNQSANERHHEQFIKQEPDFPRKAMDLIQNVAGTSSQNTVKRQTSSESSMPKFPSDSNAGPDSDEKEASASNPDRRMRTVILPDQLEYLNRKFREDSNPSRKQLRAITAEVGLNKRVVQVWFQNARARERKGPSSSSNHSQSLKHPLSGAGEGFGQIPDKKIKTESGTEGKSGDKISIPQVNMSQLMSNPYSLHPPFLPFFPPMNLLYPGDGMKAFAGNKQQEAALQKCLEAYASVKANSNTQHSPPSAAVPGNFNKPSPFKQTPTAPASIPRQSTSEMPLDLSKPLKSSSFPDANSVSCGEDSSVDFNKKRNKYANESESQSDNDDYSSNCNSKEDDFPRPFRGFGSEPGNSLIPPIHYPEGFPNSAPVNRIFDSSSQQQQNTAGLTPTSGKRHRTHMSSLQIRVMKAIYAEYKTPTITECEMLGRDIGLRKRVVQVWFQNARAKDKKNRLADGLDGDLPAMQTPASTECKLCEVRYSPSHTIRDHLFSSEHVETVKKFVKNQTESEQQTFHHESPLKALQHQVPYPERALGAKDFFGPESKLPHVPFSMATPNSLVVNPELMAKYQRDLNQGPDDKTDKMVHQQYPDSGLKPTLPGFPRIPLTPSTFPAMLPSFMPHHNLQRLFTGLERQVNYPSADIRTPIVQGPESSNKSAAKDSFPSDNLSRGSMNYSSPSTAEETPTDGQGLSPPTTMPEEAGE